MVVGAAWVPGVHRLLDLVSHRADSENATGPIVVLDYIALPGLADEDDVIVESEEGDRLYGADDDLVESDYF